MTERLSSSPADAVRAPTAAPGRVKEITSVSNPIIKDIRALAQKRHREESGLFMAEGLKLVIDALDAGWTIETLIVSKAGLADSELLSKTAARVVALGADLIEANNKVLEAVTRKDNPQSAVGIFRQHVQPLGRLDFGKDGVVVGLDRVRDPGNLGTILRTVDAVGARGVILIGDTVDPFSLEAVRATMGSVFSVPLARASEADFLKWRAGFKGLVVGTHMSGAVDYRTPDYAAQPVLVLMGNEQAGLTPALAESCDRLLRIPQAGRADSLNLAIATGVMLYEARRKALTL
ncbi:TrmH family RNA methyltransferase [Mangrovibrevibacter kandeliae]|uniref:TrmH family RNA methyltransferase n=1 Tax=Mangrovibrevibacter kandeliae TaxID=2968473 RepID=UPI0021182F1A|nr:MULTISPECIES: RNA methyltransferase [unclassified Aurantimonas]MCQ8782193.1 RNA methyltransferase [Aurantimonas sp. CSK15Z-1]MCW4115158.1 RNA methyltransferase [Aurantimonas sp. MSK8Z-1]